MQQAKNLRGRFGDWNPRAQWVQLGLLSASIMAPLIGRWNELRAAERARALREEAEARLRGIRTQLPWQRNEVLDQMTELLKQSDGAVSDTSSKRSKTSTRLWLVGVGVGLAAAGIGAYILVRRRMEQRAEEPLVDLPLSSVNGHAKGASNGLNGSYRTPVATSIGGATRSAAAPTVPELSNEQTSSLPTYETAQTIEPSTPAREATDSAETPTSVDEGTAASVTQPDDAPFIGNIRTMIYHASDAANLPAEENRIYFASEDEARAAGYRRGHNETHMTEAESQAQSNA